MPIQLSDFSSGISEGLDSSINQKRYSAGAPAGASSGSFFGDVAHSIGAGVTGAAKFVGHQILDPIVTTAKGIAQGAPIVGAADRTFKANDQRQQLISKQMDATIKAYRSKDPKVKISKDEYNKRMADLTKQQQSVNKDTQDFAKGLVDPADFAKSLVETGAMALGGAGLELKSADTTTGTLARVAPEFQQAAETQVAKIPGLGKLAPVSDATKSTIGQQTLKHMAVENPGEIVPNPAMMATRRTIGGTAKAIPKEIGKAAFISEPTGQAIAETPGDIKNHNYKDLAINAGAFIGAPAAAKGLEHIAPKVVKGASSLLFSKSGSEIGKLKFKDGETVTSYLKDLEAKAATGDKQATKDLEHYGNTARVAEAHYQEQGTKAYQLAAYHGIDRSTPINSMTAKQYLDQAAGHMKAEKVVQELDAKGRLHLEPDYNNMQPLSEAEKAVFKSPTETERGTKIGAGLWDAKEQKRVMQGIMSHGHDFVENEARNKVAWTRNPLVMAKVQSLVGRDSEEIQAEFKRAFNKTNSIGIKGRGRTGMPNGYVPIRLPKDAAMYKDASDVPQLTEGHDAPLSKVGDALRRAGISPEGTDPREVGAVIRTNFAQQLAGTRFEGRSNSIFAKLYTLIGETKGVYDPRLLRPSSIEDGLAEMGITHSEAVQIRSALDRAYEKAPLGTRALGEKLTDYLVGRLPGGRYYLKAQGYGRFTLNPIFWVKRGFKTEFVGQAETAGKPINLGRTLNKLLGTAPKDETMNLLAKHGFYSKGMASGDMADFMGDYTHLVQDNLKQRELGMYQRQTMAQVAEKFANIHGTTVEKLLEGNDGLSHELDHILRLTVGYGQKAGEEGGYLTSNFAKTLNVLVFPSRFETKVAMAGAKWFLSEPPIVQGAVVKGLLNMKQFLDSSQGQQWQKDNSEALGILKYMTPVSTVAEVFHAIQHPGQASLPDFGSVGGLPFGVISQILGDEGVTEKSPYVDPKTGEVHTQTIPTTDLARMQVALTDLVGSMYSYPGKTMGLTSKTDVTQKFLGGGYLTPKKGSLKTIQPASGGSKTADFAPDPLVHEPLPTDFNVKPAPISGTYPGSKKKKAPAYVNGYKTTTARPMPKP